MLQRVVTVRARGEKGKIKGRESRGGGEEETDPVGGPTISGVCKCALQVVIIRYEVVGKLSTIACAFALSAFTVNCYIYMQRTHPFIIISAWLTSLQ